MEHLIVVSSRKERVKKEFQNHLPASSSRLPEKNDQLLDEIIKLFEPERRKYLIVFHLERESSLTNTIFQALKIGEINIRLHCQYEF